MPNKPDQTEHTTKPGWTLIRRDYPRGEGRAVCFYRRDNVFCFVIEKWYPPFIDDDGRDFDDAYWAEDAGSGLFANLEDAEREAERILSLGEGS